MARPFKDAPERDKILARWGSLKSERSSWMPHWQMISNYFLPRNGRFFLQDRNKGGRRDNAIYDNSGTRALRILGAGLMAGATSPARPWFKLRTPDDEMNTYIPVRVWLDDVTKLLLRIMQKSNTYRALHQIYEELGLFGTSANILLPNYKNVIHNYTLTAGEYAIATDFEGNVCTLYREFERPVSEIVKEFGYENCSTSVKNLYDRGTLDAWIPIVHAIEPRRDRDIKAKDNKNMAYGSYYFEVGGDKDKFLRESGFKHFTGLCPRWTTSGGDIYGSSPAMEALGDSKQLQHEQLRKGQCIDFKTNPPLQVPTTLKNRDVDRLPGGVTYFDPTNPQAGIKSMFEVNLDLNHLLQDVVDVRERIRAAFYADLFLMLANASDTRMTATEVAERHEEKLLMLGPVTERLDNELYSPLVENTFHEALEAGLIPPPPEELQGVELGVEYVGMLHQAQKAVGVNGIDRFCGNLGMIAQFKPDVLDKFDSDYWADTYSDMLGVDPKLIVATDKAAIVRNQRAQAQQQAQQMEMAQQQSQAVKNLAQSPVNDGNALEGILSQFSGYS